MATGLLLLRVVVGVALVGHGTQKLFGWFGGHGPRTTGAFFEMLGYRPGVLLRRSCPAPPLAPAGDEPVGEAA